MAGVIVKDPDAWQYDPTMVPSFEEVEVGRYTRRVVIDSVPEARWVSETVGMTHLTSTESIAYHYEPCDLPRTETRLTWRECWEESTCIPSSHPLVSPP